MTTNYEAEAKLAEFIAGFYADPYGFVMAVFPWGEPTLPDGSVNSLRNKKGPEAWQADLLKELGEHVRENVALQALGLFPIVWRSAVASGHGVGKSALVSWIIYWLMSTRRDTRGVVTANTAAQLETKTWPELAKWHALAINKHWFQWRASSFYFAAYPDDKMKNYSVQASTVSEENTEAFAGLHNEGRTVFVIMDEASGIPDKIYEVVDGALTDGEAFLFNFGNPTRPDGPFYKCFTDWKEVYTYLKFVDSREVSHTNKLALNDIIRKYGEDSNEVRVRIKGTFPDQAFDGFISVNDYVYACERETYYDPDAPLIMAIDVARFGDDSTVIGFRKGRDARSIPFHEFHGLDTVRVADRAAELANKHKPDCIVIESTGPGAGVIDTLRSRNFLVHEVHPGSRASQNDKFINKRAEYWWKLAEAIRINLCIPDSPRLMNDLTKIRYQMDKFEQRIQLEPKKAMKDRGLKSPDFGDTLALTFAVNIARRSRNHGPAASNVAVTDYDPLGVP